MKKKCLLLFSIGACLCACANKQTTFRLDVISPNCEFTGLAKGYQKNEVATITFANEEDFYYPLKKEDFKVYGGSDYTFDEKTSQLKIPVTTNMAIEVKPRPLFGTQADYFEASLWVNEHKQEVPYTYTKIEAKWDIDNTGMQPEVAQTVLLEILNLLYCPEEREYSKLPLVGSANYEQSGEIEEMMIPLDEGGYGRIKPTEKDKSFLTESAAVLDFHSAVTLNTKDLTTKGRAIIHLNGNTIPTYLKFDTSNIKYKNFELHGPGFIEINYLNE